MKTALQRQIARLTPDQRLDLLFAIWESIENKDTAVGTSSGELTMIDAQLIESAKDPRPSFMLEEFSRKLDSLSTKLAGRRRRKAS